MRDTKDVLTEQELAGAIRSARTSGGLTQTDVAARLVERGNYDRITKQAVSKAENYRAGDGMGALRVAIYEVLTGERLSGPVWYRLKDD